MVHPVTLGRRKRMSYSRIKEAAELPDLIEVQRRSYEWFLGEGLREVFEDISPIQDYTGNIILEFVDYYLDEEPKYSEVESKEKDASYSAPLKAKIRLINKETGEVKEQEVFMGDFPLMTRKGTFIINGAERVVVSQLVRSPGVYYSTEIDKSGKDLYSSTVIPNRGAWLEYETDSKGIVHVRIDRTRKLTITTLLRALGYSKDVDIIELIGETEEVLKTLEKDNTNTQEEALLEIYKRLRPGAPPTVENATTLLDNLFFDSRRYDLAKVGRYKINKKLDLRNRIIGRKSAENIADPETGEILIDKGENITREKALLIEGLGINKVDIELDNGQIIRVLGNNFVDPEVFGLPFSLEEFGLKEKVFYPKMKELVDNFQDPEELKEEIKESSRELSTKHIIIDDIIASISYEFNLFYDVGNVDDIDHLGNRRLRSVGELLQNQFRIGLSRMERVVRERMTIQDIDVATPQALINIRPVV